MAELELCVVGARRSGHHAVINWLAAHFDHPVHFYNNVNLGESPLEKEFQPDVLDDAPYFVPYNDLPRKPSASIKYLIYNYEDLLLNQLEGPLPFPTPVLQARQFHSVLVLRDPFNLMASRLKRKWRPISPAKTVELWIDNAKEFLGITKFLRNSFLVNYNEWFCSEEYRRNLSRRLGYDFVDTGLEKVVKAAGGSSFDKTTFDSNAQEMKVLDRWQEFVAHPKFMELARHPEVVALSGELFPALLDKVQKHSHSPIVSC